MSEIIDDIERCRKLLERDPDSRVFAPLAEACRKADRVQEALEIARAGVARHPTYASGRVALARAQLALEQYDDAAGELEQALMHAPENALAHRLLGEARRNLGAHEAAYDAFARALALNPEDEEAREALSQLEHEAVPAAPAPVVADEAADESPEEGEAAQPVAESAEAGPAAESELELALEPFGEGAAGMEETVAAEAGEQQDEDEVAPSDEPLDIAQSSLAPEARESLPVGEIAEDLQVAPAEIEPAAEQADGEADGAPPEAPLEGSPAGGPGILPLDTRVEELADQYRAQGRLDRARALYRALLDGDPMNQETKQKLTELGPERGAPAEAPSSGDRAVRRKVEENVEILNRWLANIRKGAAR